MKTVLVNASQPYAVHIGAGLLARSGELIASATASRRCALVTDGNVAPLYAKAVTDTLKKEGFQVHQLVIQAGEEHKTLDICGAILSGFARYGLTRTDFAIALGGGVVGDLTGFACAIYQRGIDFIQMPTTLLAAVDASVGGKTAVDLPEGKNLAGAFHQPKLVLCDTDVFRSLPACVYAEGMAEVIKHALIADRALYEALLCGNDIPAVELVRRNVEIKAQFVCGDEREHGKRKLLNFGHTLGHAVEYCSGYAIPHGAAVAIGMVLACRAAEKLGHSGASITEAVRTLLRKYDLPVECPFGAEELFQAAVKDKKRSGEQIDIVVLKEIGRAETVRLTRAQLNEFTEAAL